MYYSNEKPNTSRISPYDQCVMRIISKRPARLSESPFSNNTREEPNKRTLMFTSLKVSASHSFFTTLLHCSISCISSMAKTNSLRFSIRIRVRADSQHSETQPRLLAGTSSAENINHGISKSASTCFTNVVLPTCRGPMMI